MDETVERELVEAVNPIWSGDVQAIMSTPFVPRDTVGSCFGRRMGTRAS